MTATTGTACGYGPCAQPVERAATGRPARYCGPACRQAAHRERVRQAEATVARAAALASAEATARRAFPRIGDFAANVEEWAGEVYRAAADDETSRGGVVAAIAELHRHVALLERVALEYRDAADLAAALAEADAAAT